MLRNKIYYRIKPFLPTAARLAARRRFARWTQSRSRQVWPIMPGSDLPPEHWPGWPNGSQFACVLTHDVESEVGLNRVRQLAQLEMDFGLRSGFNFVPEGSYQVSPELRLWLVDNGFEVGVHDLHHDGHLYSSADGFRKKAVRINHYLKEWAAVGFRSAFMLHNLEWLPSLEIEYDASCFDTDPFEPQPDGVNTIFPFWVRSNNGSQGFIELPYTLAQDSTVFLLLGEQDDSIWRAKLDWIAQRGGMALVNVHPDYISFEGKKSNREFPVELYSRFLEYITGKYASSAWFALPREVAAYSKKVLPQPPIRSEADSSTKRRCKIWVDLDNTPHVPFFVPIIRELEKRRHEVVLTARDAFQVCALANRQGLKYVKAGRHHGKSIGLKILGWIWRSLVLVRFYLREKPDIALSHGSRSQLLLSNLVRKPSIALSDWEFSKAPPLTRPRWEIVPEVYPETRFLAEHHRVRRYPGMKENVYVPQFQPNPSFLAELGLAGDGILITVRPPATDAHYHNPESEELLIAVMDRIVATPGARAVLLPRTSGQEQMLRAQHPAWFAADKTVVPAEAIDGLDLLWHSDLAVSGGGTMNREAAALGVPVYSIFRGRMGAIDIELEKEGRLTIITTAEEVHTKIDLVRRHKAIHPSLNGRKTLETIVDHIEDILRLEVRTASSRNGS